MSEWRRAKHVLTAAAVIGVAIFAVGSDSRIVAAAEQDAGLAAKDGVYTERQAMRGQEAFGAECTACHPAMGAGGDGAAPALSGSAFLGRWADRTVGDVMTTMRSSMPPNAPASLSRETYIDILAYVLKANGYPAGSTELGAGTALNTIAMGPIAR
jgi:mono/diheme cytochrome c family protein